MGKLDFFPIEKVFRKTAKTKNFSTLGLIMSEISANLNNIFREQKPPILKVEVGFFSDKKSFSQIFENTEIFFHLKVISKKKKKKSEKLFREQKPPILTLEVGFFSDRKFFKKIQNGKFFFPPNFFLKKKKKKKKKK